MPAQPTSRPTTRIEPWVSWSVLTDGPLKGLGLAREAGLVFAWDEAERLYLIDLAGGYRSVATAPGRVTAAAVSDDGSRVAVLGEGARLWLLDGDLGLIADRAAPPDPLALAIDPHGRYVVVSGRAGANHVYNRHGRSAGKFESFQPLAHLAFVAGRPLLIASAAHGLLAQFDLGSGGSGRLDVDLAWQDRQVSNVGRLTTTGDGSMILASCFTHGVQRYDAHGENDGAYHLGGTATHAVPDFAGRVIAVASLEGELAVLNPAGNVRWKTGLARPAVGLEVDPMGRYLVYGQATGEVVRLDLHAEDRPTTAQAEGETGASASASASASAGSPANPPARQTTAPRPAQTPGAGTGAGAGVSVRRADWAVPVAANDAQAETAVVVVADGPTRVGLILSTLRLQIVTAGGENLGFAPEIGGVGRILRTAPGWIAAATDRQIVLFHATRGAAQKVDLSLTEVSHLALRPDTFGLLIAQERDRVGRATVAGRWVWRHELRSAVEDLAIGPDGYSALSDDAGRMTVFDPAGAPAGEYGTDPAEPLGLIEAVEGAPGEVAWMTLARRSQVLRGHDLRGRVLWESPVAFEGWQFLRVGPLAFVPAANGRVQAFDGQGHLRGQGKAADGSLDVFGVNARGEPRRVSRQGVHLTCADLDGRVRWRAVCDQAVHAVALGREGVAAVVGRTLAWFPGLD